MGTTSFGPSHSPKADGEPFLARVASSIRELICALAHWLTSSHNAFTRFLDAGRDFFVNLLDMRTEWQAAGSDNAYKGRDRKTKVKGSVRVSI